MRTNLGDMICIEAKHSGRCHLCAEYPDKVCDKAVGVALDHSGFHWSICKACIDKLNETIKLDIVPPESSSR